VIPLFEKDGVLTVAIADPTNLRTIDHLKFKTGREIEPVIATEKSITTAIERNYATDIEQMNELLGAVQIEELDVVKHDEEEEESGKLSDEEGAQIIKLVNLIITQAVNERASDIHIEPMERLVRLRYRVDGELEEKKPDPAPASRPDYFPTQDHGGHGHRGKTQAAGRPHPDPAPGPRN